MLTSGALSLYGTGINSPITTNAFSTLNGSPAAFDVMVLDTSANYKAKKATISDGTAPVAGVKTNTGNIMLASNSMYTVNADHQAMSRGDTLVVSTYANGSVMANNAITDPKLIVGYASSSKSANAHGIAAIPTTDVTVVNPGIITEIGHGWTDNMRVVYSNGGGASIGGLTSGAAYYIINSDADTFQITEDMDSDPIEFTSTGNNAQTFTPVGTVRVWMR